MDALDDIRIQRILQVDSNGFVVNLEDDEIEFKERLDWGNPDAQKKYLKEMVALSNAGGGYLIFGVNDNTGEIVGLTGLTNVDLKIVTDQLQKYFIPSVEINGRKYEYLDKILFIIYANEYVAVPAVCMKDGKDLTNGCVYWRYSGKSEPIKGVDLHRLLNKVKSSPTSELVEVQKKHRKNNLMPKFQWSGHGMSSSRDYKCLLTNIGAPAIVVKVINDKSSNAYIERVCSSNRRIKSDEEWMIFGNYKGNFEPHNRTYKFRLYFQDEEDNLYYQEYSGEGGKIYPEYVKPVDTTIEEMNVFEELNK